MGQIEVLVGMAKSMELLKDSNDVCECKVSRIIQFTCEMIKIAKTSSILFKFLLQTNYFCSSKSVPQILQFTDR